MAEELYWDEVKSSNIAATTWVPEEDSEAAGGNMYIVFESGWMYVYFEVPPELYDSFIDAPSKGKFHHQHIKWKYSYTRLGEVDPMYYKRKARKITKQISNPFG